MLGDSITFPHLLIFLPLVAGLLTFFLKKENVAKAWALFASVVVLIISIASMFYASNAAYNGGAFDYEWLPHLGSAFSVRIDGVGRTLTFLTALSFPLIFIATYKNAYRNANSFFGLMLLTQSGLMGVFTATDALLFYFFWELALIPVYFLCSQWGGEKRIQATFKFFIYTFFGSLLMLLGIIYVYLHTYSTPFSQHSFSLHSMMFAKLSAVQQNWLFLLFFIAFAIKVPVFPFHTWQPDTYEQSPTSVTMVLSGIMVKMGLFAMIRWLIPLFPLASYKMEEVIMILAIFGILYASLIAWRQDDLKRLVAYSSIAHLGLMSAVVFSHNDIAHAGMMLQMFNHGINILGLWIVIELIERQLGIRRISQLGGLANKAPFLAVSFVVIALANIALPLTNGFVGEFMMFVGLFKYNVWMTGFAGLGIILSAVYTLNMIQKVFYGELNDQTIIIKDIKLNEKLVLGFIMVLIFFIGVYPHPALNLANDIFSKIGFK